MAAGQGRWGRHGVETVVTSLMRMQPYYDRNRGRFFALIFSEFFDFFFRLYLR